MNATRIHRDFKTIPQKERGLSRRPVIEYDEEREARIRAHEARVARDMEGNYKNNVIAPCGRTSATVTLRRGDEVKTLKSISDASRFLGYESRAGTAILDASRTGFPLRGWLVEVDYD